MSPLATQHIHGDELRDALIDAGSRLYVYWSRVHGQLSIIREGPCFYSSSSSIDLLARSMRWATLILVQVLVLLLNITAVTGFSSLIRSHVNTPQLLRVEHPIYFQQISNRCTVALFLGMDGGDNGGNSGSDKNNGGRGGGDGGDGDGEFENDGFGGFLLGTVTLLCSQLGKQKLKRKFSVIPKATPSTYSLTVHRLLSRLIVSMTSFEKTSPINLSKWYSARLESRPLVTKSLTSGLVAFCGDYLAQWFEWNLRRRRRPEIHVKVAQNEGSFNKAIKSTSSVKSSLNIFGTYDLRRGASLFVDGILFTGPLLHWGYDFFEKVIPVGNGSSRKGGSLAAILHVLGDALILDPVFVATAFTTSGLLEGQSFRDDIIPQFQNDYKKTIRMSWTMSTGLMPLEFICFRYLPLSYRVLSINLTSILWDGAISFSAHKARTDLKVADVI